MYKFRKTTIQSFKSELEIQNNLDFLARLYLPLIEKYENESNTEYKNHIKLMLSQSIKYTDNISNLKASKAARELSKKILEKELSVANLSEEEKDWILTNYDISKISVNGQTVPAINGGLGDAKRQSKEKHFHWEHATPNSQIVSKLLNLNICSLNSDLEKVNKVIEVLRLHQIIWITKEEDDKLTRAGFRDKNRPVWQDAYKSCGIIVE
ncbi:hypothetical protein [Streptococcus uberis]|uniref:hypothetical protein n=1 Tax=Streptococcus uberis TaxID=1349 RepID=UPI0037A172E0